MKIAKYIDEKGNPGWYTPGLNGVRIICKYDKKTGTMVKTDKVMPALTEEDKLKRHYAVRIAAAVAKGNDDKIEMLGQELSDKLKAMKEAKA